MVQAQQAIQRLKVRTLQPVRSQVGGCPVVNGSNCDRQGDRCGFHSGFARGTDCSFGSSPDERGTETIGSFAIPGTQLSIFPTI